MKQTWLDYSRKFLQLSNREQVLLLFSGLAVIYYVMSFLFIENQQAKITSFDKEIKAMRSGNSTLDVVADGYQQALKRDVDAATYQALAQLNTDLSEVNKKLKQLNNNLISPNEMRTALIKLLALEPGVSLLSFEVLGAEPLLKSAPPAKLTQQSDQINNSPATLNYYKHAMNIKLSGSYFQLRNYLTHLEQLQWSFFWQNFHLEVKEYPLNEVDIIIYSLGAGEEFVGV